MLDPIRGYRISYGNWLELGAAEGAGAKLLAGVNCSLAAVGGFSPWFSVLPHATPGFVMAVGSAESFTHSKDAAAPGARAGADRPRAGAPSTARAWMSEAGSISRASSACRSSCPALAVISITMAMPDELPAACPARSLGAAFARQTAVMADPVPRLAHVLLPLCPAEPNGPGAEVATTLGEPGRETETCPVFWGWGSRDELCPSWHPEHLKPLPTPGPARCPPPQRDPGAAWPEPPVWVPALGHRNHPVAPNAASTGGRLH